MARNVILSKVLLWPLSKLFGLGVAFRNYLFERKLLLKQTEFDIPVIVVGNIAVGGTGKTPHVEYVTSLLRENHHLAVLSRGYRRKTKGFVLASGRSKPDDIGDEPFQIFQKFGSDVRVAVCEKRVEGINKLREIDKDIDIVVLDDAFQHRYVKPKVAIVLTEYSRPAFTDSLMPYGRLREPASAISRADIVVVTKCPVNMKPMEYRIFKESLNLFPYQKLFFSRYVYGHLVPVFPERATSIPYPEWFTEKDSVLIVTGIANPRPFVRHIRRYKAKVRLIRFHDHVNFTAADIDAIRRKFAGLTGSHRYIITTEKDAVKLSHSPYFPPELQNKTFYLPVSVEFVPPVGDEPGFDDALKKSINNTNLY
ncbi:MAG: tetraacyldisaccharide 4'-kinase [Bacteroidales bacterium]|nr:tetraacyldisaccharide 4'-kinase [Bacteroidales bacterium]MBD5377079.1 tetraacyldisaccharide 4'-kinase [Bacteroides sp.]